jgi:hypothetical protein
MKIIPFLFAYVKTYSYLCKVIKLKLIVMGNLKNEVKQIIFNVDRNSDAINETTLIPALSVDSDFTENEDYFREDTLELGFENEAERVSKEIFEECNKKDFADETELLNYMIGELFNVSNFIGTSESYGDYMFQVVETEFEFVVVISYIN